MRLFPLVLLFGCYDGATTVVSLDLSAGVAAVKQQLHNAWPDAVGCDETPVDAPAACVAAIRAHLDEARTELTRKGATAVTSGIVLAEGELDLVYGYTAPVGAEALDDHGLSFVYLEERTQRQVEKGKPGKRRVAMFTVPGFSGKNTHTIEGRYRLLSGTVGADPIAVHLFAGKAATVRSEWVYTPDAGEATSPGAWLRERPGLEDALKASGLVVAPI